MLRRPPRVEIQRFLQRSDGVLAVAQELEDPDAYGVPECPEERRLGDVEGGRCERH